MTTTQPGSDFDNEFDRQVNRRKKKQDWEGLVRYCRGVERQVRKAIREGTATDDDKLLRIAALLELITAYLILDMPKDRLRAALEAHHARQGLSEPLDDLDAHFSYTALAAAYGHNGQPDRQREMLLRSMTCLLSRQQTEWIGNGMLELAEAEKRAANEQAAETLIDLATGIKRAARYAATR